MESMSPGTGNRITYSLTLYGTNVKFLALFENFILPPWAGEREMWFSPHEAGRNARDAGPNRPLGRGLPTPHFRSLCARIGFP